MSVIRKADSQVAALLGVSLQTWVWLIVLLVTLTGWGFATKANSDEIKAHEAVLERKADKADVDRQYDQILNRLEDLKVDIREIRRSQRQGRDDAR
jgi:Tfp pilus assembly protein PilO